MAKLICTYNISTVFTSRGSSSFLIPDYSVGRTKVPHSHITAWTTLHSYNFFSLIAKALFFHRFISSSYLDGLHNHFRSKLYRFRESF